MDRTCNKCNWLHFGVTRDYAVDEVARFTKYFDTLSPEIQQDLYGGTGSSIALYESCHRCGNTHTDFRDGVPEGKELIGVTTSPIITE